MTEWSSNIRRWVPILALGGLLACNGGDDGDDGTDGSEDTDVEDTDTTGETDTALLGDTATSPVVPTPTGDPATVPLAGTCSQETDFGGFVVELLDGFSIVDGTVTDGVVPVSILELEAAEGDCELMRRINPSCDPPCAAGTTCDFDGECIPFPVSQDLGRVTVGGLSADVSMQPLPPGNNYFDTTLPHPAFGGGELIELRTEGGAYDPVELHGVGVEPLVTPDDQVTLEEDVDLDLTWTPPADAESRSEIHVRINIDQHGLSPVQLFCVFEDDGAATVPASLITQLIDFGVTGYPNGTMRRRTADSVSVGEGCMDFIVSSPIERDVRVAGFVPCMRDEECPMGLTCNTALEICQ